MMEDIRFTVWVHRRGGSLFGDSSRPVNRDGSILAFSDEQCARAECDRITSSGAPHSSYTIEEDVAPHHPVALSDLERRLAEIHPRAIARRGLRLSLSRIHNPHTSSTRKAKMITISVTRSCSWPHHHAPGISPPLFLRRSSLAF